MHSSSQLLGHSRETFLNEKWNVHFEKQAADLDIPSGAFRSFYLAKRFNSE